MLFFSVVVIRGGRKPWVVESACKTAEASAAVPPPTFKELFVVMPPVFVASKVVIELVASILNLLELIERNSIPAVPLPDALTYKGTDCDADVIVVTPSSVVLKCSVPAEFCTSSAVVPADAPEPLIVVPVDDTLNLSEPPPWIIVCEPPKYKKFPPLV